MWLPWLSGGERMTQLKLDLKEMAREELFTSGHRLCAGCGAAIVARQVTKALRGPTIVTASTGCLEVASTIFPYTSWRMPWIHNAFENAPATASGICAAIQVGRRKGTWDPTDVVVFCGDGGTYDIGIQALSGAFERRHDFLYVLYDNEAYMNTGIQRSGGTPHGAWTTTTPAGKKMPGKPDYKKPIAHIMAAHGTGYVGTASPAYWRDLIEKARRGIEFEGPAFLHTFAPCPRGWRFPSDQTIQMAKLAVDTCYLPLWEFNWDGEHRYRLTGRSATIAKNPSLKKPVEKFLRPQGRFRHCFESGNEHVIGELQEDVDRNWEMICGLCGT